MKKCFLTLFIALISVASFAQKSNAVTLVIQTNGVCDMCEKRFAEHVPYFKGVSDYSYDAKTSKVTVVYNPQKTTPEAIRKSISDLGYNADDVKANAAARAKLPACCRGESKTSGCGHDHGAAGCGHKH